MGYTFKRPNKKRPDLPARYYAVYKLPDGRWRQEAAGKYQKDAATLLRLRESEILNGTYGKQKEISFTDYSEIWLDNYARHKLKEKTLRDYTSIIRNHLVPHFGRDLLTTIDPGKVQGLVATKIIV